MTSLGPFQFEWAVDQAGYDFVEYDHTRNNAEEPGATLLTGGRGIEIRPKGGPTRHYRPLDDNPGLFRLFADCAENEGAIAHFTASYGLIYIGEGIGGRPLYPTLAETMRLSGVAHSLVSAIEGGNKANAIATFNAIDPFPRMGVRLKTHGVSKVEIEVVPTTLWNAMLFQAAEELSKGTKFRRCKHCSTWFPYGPGTRNTARKEFCSDRCRVAWSRRTTGERPQE